MTEDTQDDVQADDKPKRAPKAKAATITVRVLRDVWAGTERTRAGTEVEVSVEDAMDGVEAGIYSRVK